MNETTHSAAISGALHPHSNGAPLDGATGAQTFAFSRFNRKDDNKPKPALLDWRGVCALLEKRRETATDSDGAKDGPAIGGARYQSGATRGNENVLAVSLAILDFDGGATLHEIKAGLCRLNSGDGAAAFIYSTWSHTPETPKFRVVIPLSAPVAALDWPDVWKRLALAFDGAPDEKAKDAARLHFLPSCPKSRALDAVSLEIGGNTLDVATLPALPQPAPEAQPQRDREARTSGAARDNYAAKVLENEIERLRSTTSGRNQALCNAALKLGHYVGAGRLHRGDVENELLDASRANGYTAKDGEKQVRDTIKSGLDAGEREPNWKGTLGEIGAPKLKRGGDAGASNGGAQRDDNAGEIPAPSMRTERGALEYEGGQLVEILRPSWTCAALSTHTAHAARVIEHIGGDLRFSPQLSWLTFNGRHWERDDRHATQTANKAKELSQIVRQEAATLYGLAGELARGGRGGDAEAMSRAAAKHTKHASQVEARPFLDGALHFAAGNPLVRVSPDAFDQRPWLLGFENGVWDAGKWREHRRDDYLLNLCPVVFDAEADQHEWERVMHAITGGDADFARTLQDVAGYILSGASHLRFLPWLYGPKGTGKSTYAELLQTVLGKMAATIDPKKLQDDSARERLGADLWNRRLAVCAEAGGQKLEAELLKTLSGADTLTVRFLYQEAFDALPRHVLLMVSNDAPRLDAYDDALKDRVVALPFVHRLDAGGELNLAGGERIEAVRKDPNSPLVRGFTAWALEGLERVYQTKRIFRAPCIEVATAKFWADTDPLTAFWETVDADELRDGIGKTELRKLYEHWCETEGARPFNRNQWSRACQSFGLENYSNGKKKSWRFTQLTQLRQFSKSPREKIKASHGVSENRPSSVSSVNSGDERELLEI